MKNKITLLLLLLCLSFSQVLLSQVKMIKAKNCNALFNTDSPFTWDGPIKNGYCHGYGTIKWYTSKGVYEGKMVGTILRGKNEGYCTFYDKNGKKTFECMYKNDLKEGIGRIYYIDGTSEEGTWVNGERVYSEEELAAVDTTDVQFDDSSLDNETVETLVKILEAFCTDYYSSCFYGRSYIENSIEVDNAELLSEGVYRVEGTHSYKGALGSKYADMPFYALIYSDEKKIEFNKQAKADYLHPSDYWEQCTKKFSNSSDY